MNELNNYTTEKKVIVYQLDGSTARAFIEDVIDKLDERCAIAFFDYYHEQLSDPGAYVTIHKEGETYSYECANHGWGGDWERATKEFLVEYIYKNREHNDGELVLAARFSERREVLVDGVIETTPFYFNIDDIT